MVSKGSANYPESTSAAVTAVMVGNKSTDTKPETTVRSILHREGLRFRKNTVREASGRKCRPDISFVSERVAIFLDGCFWHNCPEHGRTPGGKNAEYWREKFRRNSERDRLDTIALESAGWVVLRYWEHMDLLQAAQEIAAVVRQRRSSLIKAG